MNEYMDILQICYENVCDIQNINYSILENKYNAILTEASNDSPSLLTKLWQKIEDFFEKVLITMKKMLTNVLVIIDKDRGYILRGFNDKDFKKSDACKAPEYSSEDVYKWALNEMAKIDELARNSEIDQYQFKEFPNPEKLEETTAAVELAELRNYKANIKKVENLRKIVKDKYRFYMSKSFEEKEGAVSLNKMAQVTREAVRLINKRVNIACKVVNAGFKKGYTPFMKYRKII